MLMSDCGGQDTSSSTLYTYIYSFFFVDFVFFSSPLLHFSLSLSHLGLELLKPPRALLLEDFAPGRCRGSVSGNDDEVRRRRTRGELDVSGGGGTGNRATRQRHGDSRRRRSRRLRRRRCSRGRHGRAAGAQHGRGHFVGVRERAATLVGRSERGAGSGVEGASAGR